MSGRLLDGWARIGTYRLAGAQLDICRRGGFCVKDAVGRVEGFGLRLDVVEGGACEISHRSAIRQGALLLKGAKYYLVGLEESRGQHRR